MDDRTYIRVHDGMPEHWKVEDLSDGAFRQIITIWCWCARQRTDGFVPQRKWIRFGSDSDRAELVEAGLMEPVKGGMQCHDYLKHQRSRDAIRARSDASRIANHTRWHVKKKRYDPTCDLCRQEPGDPNRSDSDSDPDSEFSSDRNPPRSDRRSDGIPDQIRGEQSRAQTDGSVGAEGEGSQSVRTHAHAREIHRYLNSRYGGLTDQMSAAVFRECERRSPDPIKHPVKYLEGMELGDLADIVQAVMDAEEEHDRPHLELVPDPPEQTPAPPAQLPEPPPELTPEERQRLAEEREQLLAPFRQKYREQQERPAQ